ncbi:transglutaminase-like cysteine peptidase [Nitratireductor soli]|uniref:transglutaminase-like cysteine peptidase n=1 Tax=Nitratireductor soli TaxID=1670619 RepID=UPI000AE87167|nr:transglutaminase-like cysteine peptidase [Nitratireductor soli]
MASNNNRIKKFAIICGSFLLFMAPQSSIAFSSNYPSAYTQVSILPHLNLGSLSSTSEQTSEWLVQLKTRWKSATAQVQVTSASANGHARNAVKAASSKATGVFESVAIPFKSLPSSASWKAVYPAIVAADFAKCAPSTGCSAKANALAATVKRASGKAFGQKLSEINYAVNRSIAYTTDRENYGRLDHWAKPAQILNLGKGDCEDYAILKMAALNAAGIPMSSMSIVVLQDQRRALFHAVLAVSTSQGHFILDNLHDRVMKDSALGDYLPLYSMSEDRSWIHGKKRGDKLVASIGALPDNLSPGEGIAPELVNAPHGKLGGAPAAGR